MFSKIVIMQSEKMKLAGCYVTFQLGLFIVLGIIAVFTGNPKLEWLLVLIPFLFWILLFVQVLKGKFIDLTVFILFLMFMTSFTSVIKKFHYLNIFALMYHLFFIIWFVKVSIQKRGR